MRRGLTRGFEENSRWGCNVRDVTIPAKDPHQLRYNSFLTSFFFSNRLTIDKTILFLLF
jgi:hypothetical protein